MQIGILQTGESPDALRADMGDYPDFFETLLAGKGLTFRRWAVLRNEFPDSVHDCDGWLITGSRHGAYEPHDWIPPLEDFIRAAYAAHVPVVGICFGHQIMAQAFGGKVIKSPKGWGLGLQRYRLAESLPWMDSGEPIAVPGSHQDQVVEAPPGAKVIGGNEFCELGMLDYGEGRAISLQLHPEFEPDYAKALIETRRGARLTEEEADRAVMSYEQPDDRQRVGGWLQRFIETA